MILILCLVYTAIQLNMYTYKYYSEHVLACVCVHVLCVAVRWFLFMYILNNCSLAQVCIWIHIVCVCVCSERDNFCMSTKDTSPFTRFSPASLVACFSVPPPKVPWATPFCPCLSCGLLTCKPTTLHPSTDTNKGQPPLHSKTLTLTSRYPSSTVTPHSHSTTGLSSSMPSSSMPCSLHLSNPVLWNESTISVKPASAQGLKFHLF